MPDQWQSKDEQRPARGHCRDEDAGERLRCRPEDDRPRNQLDRRPQARKETDPGASTPDDPSPSKHPGKADTCVPERDTVRETTHESETKQDNRKFERADASELRPEDRVETRDEYPDVQG